MFRPATLAPKHKGTPLEALIAVVPEHIGVLLLLSSVHPIPVWLAVCTCVLTILAITTSISTSISIPIAIAIAHATRRGRRCRGVITTDNINRESLGVELLTGTDAMQAAAPPAAEGDFAAGEDDALVRVRVLHVVPVQRVVGAEAVFHRFDGRARHARARARRPPGLVRQELLFQVRLQLPLGFGCVECWCGRRGGLGSCLLLRCVVGVGVTGGGA